MLLAWQDYAVLLVYLGAMLTFGALLARRQRSDQEYFLAGRRMPWLAVGVSVIASLLSSLTYLSEPGEVWNSGITHIFGKLLAIPLEMLIVFVFCIPFMMRFRFTSAYEYLEHRFGLAARRLGVAMFLLLVVLWMGFVVLATSRALATVTGFDLLVVLATVGIVATVYTMLGGLRAVIWTDVVQVILLVGGGLFTIGFVAATTGTSVLDWYDVTVERLAAREQQHELVWFSLDPTVRTTVLTVAVNMCIWHVCTHTGNQMTVQRYFSTSSMQSARRSFVVASLAGVFLNVMLVVVGLALLYFYFGQGIPVDGSLDVAQRSQRNLIFPTFAVHRLPAGIGGGLLAALLAAAMSTIDSGVNSIATVLSSELSRSGKAHGNANGGGPPASHVSLAMAITLVSGVFITFAAYGLSFMPAHWGIVDAMPRTFNAVTAPLGALFLIGMFLPGVGQRAVVAAALCGMLVSIGIGYFDLYMQPLLAAGWLDPALLRNYALVDDQNAVRSLSFTWVMPCALLTTVVTAWLFSLLQRGQRPLPGLTWQTRHARSPWTDFDDSP